MDDEPDATIIEMLRREAFEEIGRMEFMAEEYAQKLFDATERRDPMASAVRLQQLRLCTIAMIQTFNQFLRTPHGQGMAAEARSSRAAGEGERSSDGVA